LKIVVLNDLHPSEQAGAASVALQYANFLSQENDVEFWCSKPRDIENYPSDKFQTWSFNYSKLKRKLQKKSKILRFFSEIIDLKVFFYLIWQSKKFKPDLVWLHQIGNAIPKTVPLVFWALRISVVQTHHDYSCFSLGKLFPSDFGLSQEEVCLLGSSPDKPSNNKIRLEFVKGNFIRNLLFQKRARLLICISNLNFKNILLSPQQKRINQSFDLRSTLVIPNSAQECSCSGIPNMATFKPGVLFAGRPVAKGLHDIARIVENSSSCKLYIAGKPEIMNYLPQNLSASKYEYLGELSQNELFHFMHSVEYVSVLSECFDVFPSILLEAISHGCKVICSPTVGNGYLLAGTNLGYMLESRDVIPDLTIDLISERIRNSPLKINEKKIIPSIDLWKNQINSVLNELRIMKSL